MAHGFVLYCAYKEVTTAKTKYVHGIQNYTLVFLQIDVAQLVYFLNPFKRVSVMHVNPLFRQYLNSTMEHPQIEGAPDRDEDPSESNPEIQRHGCVL